MQIQYIYLIYEYNIKTVYISFIGFESATTQQLEGIAGRIQEYRQRIHKNSIPNKIPENSSFSFTENKN